MLHKPKILIVDDIEVNRIILEDILGDAYDIDQACNGIEAVEKMTSAVEKPCLVLLDIMMPEMDGFAVLKHMKSTLDLQKIPAICITAAEQELRALGEGAVDYISKPFEPQIVCLRVENQIELSIYRKELERLVDKKARELMNAREKFFDTMVNLIEHRSLESGEHSKRTRLLAREVALQLIKDGKYAKEIIDNGLEEFVSAVPLHDIGKIAVPDHILLKPGRLTPEEFEEIKKHSDVGSEVIKSLMDEEGDIYLSHCYNICRHHHERWDGAGYPDGLRGTDIPLDARIVSVVDVYDALVGERVYKQAMPHERAVEIITKGSGSQFDPDVVDAFLKVQDKLREIEKN